MRASAILGLSALVWAGVVSDVAASSIHDAAVAASSTLDGVFTEAQAKRGQAAYAASCASCHGDTLHGADGPALVGPMFIANWNGSTVGDLVDRTRSTMPDDNPGTLTREQYTDVITYVLSANRYPAGKAELPVDTDKQKRIKIEAIRRPGL